MTVRRGAAGTCLAWMQGGPARRRQSRFSWPRPLRKPTPATFPVVAHWAHRTTPSNAFATTPSRWPGWPKRSGRWPSGHPAGGAARTAGRRGGMLASRRMPRSRWWTPATRHQREWRAVAAARANARSSVETDVVVPVGVASPKDEFTAATFVPRSAGRDQAVLPPPARRGGRRSASIWMPSTSPPWIRGGARAPGRRPHGPAGARLAGRDGAPAPGWPRSSPASGRVSRPAQRPERRRRVGPEPVPALRQLSPLEAALAAQASGSPGAEAFLEELIVRRELAVQLCLVQPGLRRLPRVDVLGAGRSQPPRQGPAPGALHPASWSWRCATHDPYWNAAQLELVATGKMHSCWMRMYWGKKILGVERVAPRRLPRGRPPQRPVRTGRSRSQRLRRRGLVLRQTRPAVGGAACVRENPLHGRRRPETQVRRRRLRRADARAGRGGRVTRRRPGPGSGGGCP